MRKQYDPVFTIRIPPQLQQALEAYRSSLDENISRSEAVRQILADWLRTHGFSETKLQPTGPATEVVKAMDEAISGDRKRRKSGGDASMRPSKGKAWSEGNRQQLTAAAIGALLVIAHAIWFAQSDHLTPSSYRLASLLRIAFRQPVRWCRVARYSSRDKADDRYRP